MITRPRPRSIIGGTNTRAARNAPVRLVSMQPIPVGLVHRQRVDALGDAGRVEHDVHAAELVDARVAHARQRGRVGHVGREPQRAASPLFNFGGNLVARAIPAGRWPRHRRRRRPGRAQSSGRCRWWRRPRRPRVPVKSNSDAIGAAHYKWSDHFRLRTCRRTKRRAPAATGALGAEERPTLPRMYQTLSVK